MNSNTIIAFLFLVLSFPLFSLAQTEPATEKKTVPERFVYEWTDDKGVIHLTEDPGKVPQKYQNKIRKKKEGAREEETPENAQGRAVESAPQPTAQDQEFEQQRRKDQWRERYFDWKEKLQRSEQEHQSLQKRRDALITKWGSLAVAPIAVREEAGQVDQALQDTQAEIDEARHMLEVVLPDEARKAGVPPGWLRE
jgi:hypothetical protein